MVSEHTVGAVGEIGCEELRLERLGRYRLRDFDGPVALFQADAVEIPHDFPALRAVPAVMAISASNRAASISISACEAFRRDRRDAASPSPAAVPATAAQIVPAAG